MQKKWMWVGVAVVALVAVAVWVNVHSTEKLPDGFAGGNGRLELQRMDVATLYAGRVVAMKVNEGDEVAKDAVLAELSSDQSSSQLAGAKAAKIRAEETVARATAEILAQQQQQKVAQMELDNTQQLKNDALVSAAELKRRLAARDGAAAAVAAAKAAKAEAQAAVGQAQAQIDAASSANKDMLIRAPQAGRVEYRIAEAGNVLGAGSKVVTLLDPSDVSMSVFLPTNTVGQLKIGDEARIVLDGLDAVFPATVDYIAAEAQFTPKYVETANEREKLMYKVKLSIPAEVAKRYSGLLKGGLTGNGYVRVDAKQAWPASWQVKLPSGKGA
ncbi:HlyD family secretion protein [Snodgrassella sp. CFCC 13594]|uniref:HlyD family secretion protein n=1 Tax=Snodgrassella sp. CFCC 13594 TaxID=1775559 RepID=UPI00082DDD62|nr:HlyD family efflux transporter periplasmic adaptor subunit [Snodgrassella sp. CFCC 13594]